VKVEIVMHDQGDMMLPCGDQIRETPLRTADATLVALAKTGDEDAYAALIKDASPGASRAIRRILHAEADAQDALQEACIRSYFKLSTFDGRAKFSTWFTRIAINSALMIRRKHKNGYEVMGEPEKNELLLMSLVDPRADPLSVVRAKEEYEALRDAIDSLPHLLKESLQIRLDEDLSINELATRLHLSLPATKTRLLRAKRRVIASASVRLLPSVCVDGEIQKIASIPPDDANHAEPAA
jgi:RNA polymerase sigma-70 factor (ECF subfamily)